MRSATRCLPVFEPDSVVEGATFGTLVVCRGDHVVEGVACCWHEVPEDFVDVGKLQEPSICWGVEQFLGLSDQLVQEAVEVIGLITIDGVAGV